MAFSWKVSFFVVILVLFISSSNLVTIQSAHGQDGTSSNTDPRCVYELTGFIFQTTGSCPLFGTPTVVSQTKMILTNESSSLLLEQDKNTYRKMIFGGLQCGACWHYDLLKACKYDSNGDFVGGIPLQKLSDAQKEVISDMNATYSVTICPFKGQPTPVEVLPPLNTTVIGGLAKSVSNETVQKTAQVSQKVWLSPLKQMESGIKIQDIKCKENFVLVIKESNSQPSCVKPTSEQRLLSHGWIVPKFENMQIINHNETANIVTNEKVITTVNGTSNTTTDTSNGTITESMINKRYHDRYTGIDTGVTGEMPLPSIHVTPTITSTSPNSIKILFIGMSPNSLKVRDIPHFTLTWQNISDKPIYAYSGCTATPLGLKITPPDNVLVSIPSGERGPKCPDHGDLIEPNQINTDIGGADPTYEKLDLNNFHSAGFSHGFYQIMKSGTLHVTMELFLRTHGQGDQYDIMETVQFNVNATQ